MKKIVLEKFDELNSKIDANTKSFDKLSKELHETKENVNTLSEKVENNTALINRLTQDVRDTQDILKIQGQNLAHFEHALPQVCLSTTTMR